MNSPTPTPFWNSIINNCVQDVSGAKDVATLKCIPAIFQLVLNFIFGFAGTVALFFVFFAGFKFLTSGGDPKQVEGARKTLTYAIIGLVVIILSFAIINFIAHTFMPGNPDCLLKFGLIHC